MSGFCHACESECAGCNGTARTCTSCGFGQVLQNYTCVGNCSDGYYTSGDMKTCVPCGSGCSRCNDFNECLDCYDQTMTTHGPICTYRVDNQFLGQGATAAVTFVLLFLGLFAIIGYMYWLKRAGKFPESIEMG